MGEGHQKMVHMFKNWGQMINLGLLMNHSFKNILERFKKNQVSKVSNGNIMVVKSHQTISNRGGGGQKHSDVMVVLIFS